MPTDPNPVIQVNVKVSRKDPDKLTGVSLKRQRRFPAVAARYSTSTCETQKQAAIDSIESALPRVSAVLEQWQGEPAWKILKRLQTLDGALALFLATNEKSA